MPPANITNINLKVLIMDTDFYAMQAVNSYLAWDRRTRVTNMSENLNAMWTYIDRTALPELPDVVLLDADHVGGPDKLHGVITRLRQKIERVHVICLAQLVDPALVSAAADAGGSGFLLKQDVRLQIAWAIVYAMDEDFTITSTVYQQCRDQKGLINSRILHAKVLPERRNYPELTERIRQAIELCVIRGMSAALAADEMGISQHTIRGYVKEGYRVLETYDETDYPVDMTPQEKAFMRFTAFGEEPRLDSETTPEEQG